MARLDPFLELLAVHGGDALRLQPGRPVEMERRGLLRPVSREALDPVQVTALIREIAPPAMAPLLGPRAQLSFAYEAPVGPVVVEVAPADGALGATLTLRPRETASVPAPTDEPSAVDLGRARADLDALLRILAERGGSDLHLRAGERPALRRDGDLARLETDPLAPEDLERMLRSVLPGRLARRWAETGDALWAWEVPGLARFRAQAGRDRNGSFAVFRHIPAVVRSAEDLGLSREVQRLADRPRGLVLVTGPAGSGRSTTLAALIDLVNRRRSDHILTIEDPIEFVHRGLKGLVTQRELGVHIRSFAAALRSAAQEDADVILVSDLGEGDAVLAALEAAEGGALVFGALPASTAVGALDRLLDQVPAERRAQARVLLAEGLQGVVAQVLCRKTGGGRVAAREVLLATPTAANLIREGKTFQLPAIMQANRKAGMIPLGEALLDLVDAGEVEPREALLRAPPGPGFLAGLRARGHRTEPPGDG